MQLELEHFVFIFIEIPAFLMYCCKLFSHSDISSKIEKPDISSNSLLKLPN